MKTINFYNKYEEDILSLVEATKEIVKLVSLNIKTMDNKQQSRYIPDYFNKEDKKIKPIEEKKFQTRKVEIEFDGIKTHRVSVLPQ